jgi:hypothetical protein
VKGKRNEKTDFTVLFVVGERVRRHNPGSSAKPLTESNGLAISYARAQSLADRHT